MSALPFDAVPAVPAVGTALEVLRATIVDAIAAGEIRIAVRATIEEELWI